jgi:hypothetical protein
MLSGTQAIPLLASLLDYGVNGMAAKEVVGASEEPQRADLSESLDDREAQGNSFVDV